MVAFWTMTYDASCPDLKSFVFVLHKAKGKFAVPGCTEDLVWGTFIDNVAFTIDLLSLSLSSEDGLHLINKLLYL